jgi:hypothetical protein
MRRHASVGDDSLMTTHEYWRHAHTGEVWAVRLLDGVVVGCCGPLHHDDLDPDFLPDLDYVEDGAAGIEEAREEFALLELV